ncbi:MDR family MFS transporter [Enterococcus cecorum]|uniref:MDR family MFS transporter n=1 Tax=Enterococcus cecorum TaxID=44008 RepID=UPI00148BD8A3|nr:MFS transporter [Enterococcus cecorum]MCJ0522523.1 MFS transporter [Enterococcus cecorum]MCJ0560692.1 MFS transporter [Enterococcus cecorum]MCJ0574447.1 MFS transporter [Enterococcus cecorum]MCJ0576156.1 MFS transporter [Enterococcus cecorum]MCJ0598730.1 MFS transporter [Enterococcus cecorum]
MKKEVSFIAVLLGAFFTSFGMSFIWPLTSVYLHDNLHISLTLVGLVLFFNSLASVIGNVVGGLGFDRRNPYYLMLAGGIVMTVTLIVLTLFHQAVPFAICLFFLGLAAGWNGTLVSALGATLKRFDGRYVFNMIYFVQNFGIVIGSSVVGFLYDWDLRLPFFVSTLISLGFLAVVLIGYHPLRNLKRATNERKTDKMKIKLPKMNQYLMITLLTMLLITWTMYQQWGSNVSVYMTSLGIPFRYYSVLWTVNAGLILLIQFFIVRYGQYIKNHFMPIYIGILMFAFSFVVLSIAKQYYMFVCAMVLLTIGEALAFPQVPVIVNRITPEGVKGKYLGLVNSFGSAGRAISPLFGGLMIETFSYRTLFIVAVFFNLAILLVVWLARQKTQDGLYYY